ncbi:SDR family oxidoreductase [Neisseriaceae bacterium JH1-16]|nr:SDR family oxidoreductase [Neisseriaceae bacterium JH1-16]
MQNLAHQRILIIGGSAGMGLGAAQRLAKAGAEVLIAGRSQQRLDQAVASIEGHAAGYAADFTNSASLTALFARIGRIDHLVLAASSSAAWGPIAQVSGDALSTALNQKLVGYWMSIQAAIPQLRPDGSITLLSGAASRTPMPGTAALAAVNGGITQMAQTLALELAPLRVNVISPGLVDTPAYDGMSAEAKAGMFAAAAARLPLGRTGAVDDIAQAVEFLIASSWTTGALLDVDGGARMPVQPAR